MATTKKKLDSVMEEKPKEEKKEVVKKTTTKKESTDNFNLDDFNVDLSLDEDISIVDAEIKNYKNELLRPSKQVVLIQSNYVAHLESISFQDILSLKNSNSTAYDLKRKLYALIYNKMVTTSMGKMSFETFLERTSINDLPTLLFGLYSQTFQSPTEFSITCMNELNSDDKLVKKQTENEFDEIDKLEDEVINDLKNTKKTDSKEEFKFSSGEEDSEKKNEKKTHLCRTVNSIKVFPNEFVHDASEEVLNKVTEIIYSNIPIKEVVKQSILNNKIKIQLPKSKLIINAKIPSLKDQLNLLKEIPSKVFEDQTEIILNVLYTYSILLPNIKEYKESGKVTFIEKSSLQDKYDIFKELDFEDLEKLEEKLNEVLEDNVINYQLPVRKCEKCGGDLENSQVDFEGLLFQRVIRRG